MVPTKSVSLFEFVRITDSEIPQWAEFEILRNGVLKKALKYFSGLIEQV